MIDYGLLQLSEGCHLCARCSRLPQGCEWNTTQFVHPCKYMSLLTDGFSIDPLCDNVAGLELRDNGMGFWVIKCPFFGPEPITYAKYINSLAWQDKRTKRLKRDGYKCQICGTGKNLTVHHITYERFGCEKMTDLVTLCKKCHAKVHERDLT